ncbi:SF-assemblin/beta giardin family protein [Theileria parva strain Muguga]|uniref:SF-assemblin n=1 Tax=Theileria parva TaxID=5875 RepID=Q4N7Z4_THEPA|nr:SF-assemblin/beta giardin family protein [Theileria parva strain Muguga]EAN33914.1 SF-assemblin/beta giardin family protein [Theileria parva strain Muguga]|eukprot:XP_766197.1 hypothetical protein [Theileria parva strain Muguga]
MAECLERMSTSNTLEEKPSLDSIREKLATFESSAINLKIKQKDDLDKFNSINEMICDLNDQLLRESQERLQSRELLQKVTEEAANRMLSSVQSKLNHKVRSLAEKLDKLIDKCATLENSVNELDNKINRSGYLELVECDIAELKAAVRNDIVSKVDKDTDILDRICYLQNSNRIKINDNNIWNNECIKEIKQNITQFKMVCENENEIFLKYITVELNNLKTALESTSASRKQSDNFILQTIDHMMSFLPKLTHN